MDRRELVESSSSQNVNISIASLQKRGSGKETVTVFLSEGSSFFMPLPLQESWVPGYLLNEDDLLFLKEEDAYVRGKEWAASRLALREDSSGRMAQKLLQREYPASVVRRIIDDLTGLGFLDDQRFASLWLRERIRSHPEGKESLTAGLQKRGVPSGIARSCVDEYVNDRDIDEGLQRLIDKLTSVPSVDRDKLIRKLQRRGFSYSSIIKKLDRDNF
ncbi:MAG: regulatory protein RecX [Spirochaetales bacterium]|nr:regulatory protein RecX [Spirochaetales bacterium]